MFSLRWKCSVKSQYFVQKFQRILLYSTSTNGFNQTFAEYLVNHLDFSQQEAISTSTKLQNRKVNYSNLTGNANSVIHFFKQHDFDDTHLRKIVSLCPRILCCDVDKTIKPKFKLLQDEGLSGSDLIGVVSANPLFVAARQMNGIIPNLRSVLGSDEKLVKFLKKPNSFTTLASLKNLVSNVALLTKDYGVDIEVIRKTLVLQYRTFLRSPEYFQNVVIRVEEEFRIPRDCTMFLYGISFLSSFSKKSIESKCQVFKSFGWTDNQISDLIRRNPCCISSSVENLRKKLGFLMNELGYKPDFLASRCSLFSYSLEKRMMPRYRVLLILKEKGLLDYNFYTATQIPEAKFLKIVELFKDDVLGLLEIYQNSKGCPNSQC